MPALRRVGIMGDIPVAGKIYALWIFVLYPANNLICSSLIIARICGIKIEVTMGFNGLKVCNCLRRADLG